MYCDHCGKKIDDDSIFCKFCGTKLLKKSPSSYNKIVKQRRLYKKPCPKLYCAIIVHKYEYEDIWRNIINQNFSEKCTFYDVEYLEDTNTGEVFNQISLSRDITHSFVGLDEKIHGKAFFYNCAGSLISEHKLDIESYKISHDISVAFGHTKEPFNINNAIKDKLLTLLSKDVNGVFYNFLPFGNIQTKFNSTAFLIFDIRTTGFPLDENAPIQDESNWPHLVQISWELFNIDKENTISKHSYIVKPEGFSIPKSSTKIHGITNNQALKEGKPLEEVLDLFMTDLECTNIIIGHNVLYNIDVVSAELHRMRWNNYVSLIQSLYCVCTMDSSKSFCKLPSHDSWEDGYRSPMLQELYFKLFGENLEDDHNIEAYLEATKKCFIELSKRGFVKLPDGYYDK